MDFAADLALFYSDTADTVSGPSGDFHAFLDPMDEASWDSARVSTHTLRYPDSTPLASGQLLTIKGQTYKVAAIPLRLNADEYTAELVKQ